MVILCIYCCIGCMLNIWNDMQYGYCLFELETFNIIYTCSMQHNYVYLRVCVRMLYIRTHMYTYER